MNYHERNARANFFTHMLALGLTVKDALKYLYRALFDYSTEVK